MDFGTIFAIFSTDMTDGAFDRTTKMAGAMSSPGGSNFKRNILRDVGDFLIEHSSPGERAPGYHLKAASTSHPYTKHHDDLYRHVCRTLRDFDEEVATSKEASQIVTQALPALGASGKFMAYGGLGTGAGLGALYWLLSRDARQGTAELEAKEQQLDYYNQISKRLRDSLDRKYGYQDGQQQY